MSPDTLFERSRVARIAALVVLAHAPALAVTPLTPRLDAATHARFSEQLEQARVPEVGRNSVLIATLSALGMAPQDATYDYDQKYRHLPIVHATARKLSEACASVSAVVDGAADAGYARVEVTGRFCVVGPARWASSDVVATRSGER